MPKIMNKREGRRDVGGGKQGEAKYSLLGKEGPVDGGA
jgi:hypothetical protein